MGARMMTGVTGTTTAHTVTTSKVTTRVTTWDTMPACVVSTTRTRAQTQVALRMTRGGAIGAMSMKTESDRRVA